MEAALGGLRESQRDALATVDGAQGGYVLAQQVAQGAALAPSAATAQALGRAAASERAYLKAIDRSNELSVRQYAEGGVVEEQLQVRLAACSLLLALCSLLLAPGASLLAACGLLLAACCFQAPTRPTHSSRRSLCAGDGAARDAGGCLCVHASAVLSAVGRRSSVSCQRLRDRLPERLRGRPG